MHTEHMAAAIHAAGRGEAVIVAAPTSRDTRRVFERMIPVLANVKGVELVRTNGHESVGFDSGGVVRFLSIGGQGYRGYVADRVFLPISTPAETVADILPCLATRPAGILVGY